MDPQPSEFLWQRFGVFADTACRIARQQLSSANAETVVSALMSSLAVVSSPTTGCVVLSNYFQVPAHIAAVNSLDHNQFVNDLVFGPQGQIVPLRRIFEEFSRVGPQAHGEVWLRLLDVADVANPVDIQTAACRTFIEQQMRVAGGQVVPVADSPKVPISMPNPAQLDNILGSVLTAFPGLQQCVSSLMNNPNGTASETDLSRVVDQVQSTLLDPIVQSLQQSNPNAKDAGKAIDMIMSGFKTLTSAMTTQTSGTEKQSGEGGGSMETTS